MSSLLTSPIRSGSSAPPLYRWRQGPAASVLPFLMRGPSRGTVAVLLGEEPIHPAVANTIPKSEEDAMNSDPGGERGDGEARERDPVEGPPGSVGSTRPSFARLHEELQRIDGPGRWTVDSCARGCNACRQELPQGVSFWTVLEDPPDGEGGEGLAALFARNDYCDNCSEGIDLEGVYARWRTVLPEAQGPPKKIVNLASLLGTFLSYTEKLSGDQEGGSPEGEEQRLAFLLALFLVRKRVLKWISVEEGVVSVSEKGKEEVIRVAPPPLNPQQMESAVAEFEALLG